MADPVRPVGPVYVETLHKIVDYDPCQLNRAMRIAYAIGRGKLVLAEPPLKRG